MTEASDSSARRRRRSSRPSNAPSGADRNYGGMPNEDVRGLEVRTMQFEHTHICQAAQRAGDQSRGGGVDREPVAKHQPAQQRGGDCMEKTGEQTCDAGRKTLLSVEEATLRTHS